MNCGEAMADFVKIRMIPPVRRSFRRLVAPRADGVRGTAAIEFGIIAPVLVFMAIAAMDLGMGVYRKMQVQNAAQAGLEYAIVHGFDSGAIKNAVTSATTFSGVSASPPPNQFCGCASNTGIAPMACNSTCSGGATPGAYVTVSTQGAYTTLLSYPGIDNTFSFTAQSTVRIGP